MQRFFNLVQCLPEIPPNVQKTFKLMPPKTQSYAINRMKGDVFGCPMSSYTFIFTHMICFVQTKNQSEKETGTMERQTLTMKEIANYFGVQTDTIHVMVKCKKYPHVKVKNRILFIKESIDLWIWDREYTNEGLTRDIKIGQSIT